MMRLVHTIRRLLSAPIRGVIRGWRGLRQPLIRRRLRRFVLISVAVWLAVVAWLTLTTVQYGQQDNTQEADVIIVLGAGLRRDGRPGDALTRRSRWAAQLWQRDIAPYVICTGGQTPGYPRSEAEGCREVLISYGVPPERILLETRSRSTEENALNTHAIMRQQGWGSAALVTDSYHMLRANWIFEEVGIAHYPSPVPQDWVRRSWYWSSLAREIVALHWQLVKQTLNLPFTHVPFG